MILAAFGLMTSIMTNWITLLIPAILIVLCVVLYKYPPKRYRKGPKVKPSARTAAKLAAQKRRSTGTTSSASGKRKHYPFQVIEGQKGKNDNDQPKYH